MFLESDASYFEQHQYTFHHSMDVRNDYQLMVLDVSKPGLNITPLSHSKSDSQPGPGLPRPSVNGWISRWVLASLLASDDSCSHLVQSYLNVNVSLESVSFSFKATLHQQLIPSRSFFHRSLWRIPHYTLSILDPYFFSTFYLVLCPTKNTKTDQFSVIFETKFQNPSRLWSGILFQTTPRL